MVSYPRDKVFTKRGLSLKNMGRSGELPAPPSPRQELCAPGHYTLPLMLSQSQQLGHAVALNLIGLFQLAIMRAWMNLGTLWWQAAMFSSVEAR